MRYALILFGALLASTGCQPAAEAPAPEPESAMSDEDQLRAFTDEFTEAWGRGDAAAIAAMFVEEGDTVDPGGEAFHGRAEVQRRYEDLFAEMYAGTTISITQTSAKFPSPDIAIVHGSYTISGLKTPDGGDMPVKGLYLNVNVRQDGAWKIHCSRPMVPMTIPGT